MESSPPSPEVVARLVEGHREFLAFLERHLRSRAAAEDVLQAAFARALERGHQLRTDESAVAWFYRLLRNAIVDHHRRNGTATDGLARLANEPAAPTELELRGAVCACVNTLIPNLKAEYADIVRRVDLDERPLAEAAHALGITTNNATVRLHRARKALKRELEKSCGTCTTHGCLDCTCSSP